MKAVVFHGIGDIRMEDVPDPQIEQPTDAIVRLTRSAICGTDLHMIRGTMPGMKEGTVMGHEGVGVIEQVGDDVRNLQPGDRVVIPSTIACGTCAYCRYGYYAQCDRANPNGPLAGTAFFGGPGETGPFDGLQGEKARVPFAHVNLVKLPDDVTDDQAILLSDIFPTGYMAADMAEIHPGCVVAVFGCGPVGQFAIASAFHLGAGRVIAVDAREDRLQMARVQGAECVNYDEEDPVAAIRRLTGGSGADRVIDAVGVDANRPHGGPAQEKAEQDRQALDATREQVVEASSPQDGSFHPGDAPDMALRWAVDAVAKAGTVSLIGVYGENVQSFPIGKAFMKNVRVHMGNCHHRRYIPQLIELVRTGAIDPTRILTQDEPMTSVIDAYRAFDQRQPGWIKVELQPGA